VRSEARWVDGLEYKRMFVLLLWSDLMSRDVMFHCGLI